MGYDFDELLRDLDSTKMTLGNLFSDIVSMVKPELSRNYREKSILTSVPQVPPAGKDFVSSAKRDCTAALSQLQGGRCGDTLSLEGRPRDVVSFSSLHVSAGSTISWL